jgi:hypothetical protein
MPRRTIVAGAVALALIVVVLANIHLVNVAIQSQPDCVAHVKPGTDGERGAYSAAQSAC